MKIGVIQTIDQSNGLTILFDGETDPTVKKFKYLNSYYPKLNDKVIVDEVGGSFVILGAITDDYSTTATAKKAETATTSTTATNATYSDALNNKYNSLYPYIQLGFYSNNYYIRYLTNTGSYSSWVQIN